MIKQYRKEDCSYYGAFPEESAPEDAIEVLIAPLHAKQIFNIETDTWGEYNPPQPDLLLTLIMTAYAMGDLDVPWEIFAFTDAIRYGASNETLRKLVWSRLKAENHSWLTPAFNDKIVAWAIQAHCPLE